MSMEYEIPNTSIHAAIDRDTAHLPRSSYWRTIFSSVDLKPRYDKIGDSVAGFDEARQKELGEDFINILPVSTYKGFVHIQLYNNPERIAKKLLPNQVVIRSSPAYIEKFGNDRCAFDDSFFDRKIWGHSNFTLTEGLIDMDTGKEFKGYVCDLDDFLNGKHTLFIAYAVHCGGRKMFWQTKECYILSGDCGHALVYCHPEGKKLDTLLKWPPLKRKNRWEPNDRWIQKRNFSLEKWEEYFENSCYLRPLIIRDTAAEKKKKEAAAKKKGKKNAKNSKTTKTSAKKKKTTKKETKKKTTTAAKKKTTTAAADTPSSGVFVGIAGFGALRGVSVSRTGKVTKRGGGGRKPRGRWVLRDDIRPSYFY